MQKIDCVLRVPQELVTTSDDFSPWKHRINHWSFWETNLMTIAHPK